MSEYIEIPDNNPFVNDKLNRTGEVVKFVDFVSRYGDTGCTIALNGAWGCGKTTFVRMAKAYMQSNDYHPLYFNAWENDFLEEPLFALLAEMNNLFSTTGKNADLLGKAAQVLSLMGNNFLKQKTGVDVTELTECLQSSLAEYTKTIKAFDEFKNALSEYVANNTTNIEKPVVFFIDELDRCNPNYAIKVLERVKHLFEVPNIVFVLSINKDILNHAVRTYYGNEGMDADNYLRRFIDIDYDMPVNKMDDYFWAVYKQYGFEKYENQYIYRNNAVGQTRYQEFKKLFFQLCKASNLDLRTTNKICLHVHQTIERIGDRPGVSLDLMLILCYIKVGHRSAYDKIKNHLLDKVELLNTLGEIWAQDIVATDTDSDVRQYLTYYSAVLLYSYLCTNSYRPQQTDLEDKTYLFFDKEKLQQVWGDVIGFGGRLEEIKYLFDYVDFKISPYHSNR